MKRALLATAALFLSTSFATPVGAEPVSELNNGEYRSTTNEIEQVANGDLYRAGAFDVEQVLYDYVEAIADRDYESAYNLHSPQYRSHVSYDAFVRMYQNIGTVSIRAVELLPNFSNENHKEFRVHLNATYPKTLPSDNGRFPEFFILVPSTDGDFEWAIDGMAPGP